MKVEMGNFKTRKGRVGTRHTVDTSVETLPQRLNRLNNESNLSRDKDSTTTTLIDQTLYEGTDIERMALNGASDNELRAAFKYAPGGDWCGPGALFYGVGRLLNWNGK